MQLGCMREYGLHSTAGPFIRGPGGTLWWGCIDTYVIRGPGPNSRGPACAGVFPVLANIYPKQSGSVLFLQTINVLYSKLVIHHAPATHFSASNEVERSTLHKTTPDPNTYFAVSRITNHDTIPTSYPFSSISSPPLSVCAVCSLTNFFPVQRLPSPPNPPTPSFPFVYDTTSVANPASTGESPSDVERTVSTTMWYAPGVLGVGSLDP